MEHLAEIAMGTTAAALVAGGYLYAGMWPTSQIFGNTLTASRSAGEIALTYDDGPSPDHTPALLDLLAEHNVRATFFMMGQHVQRHAHLARRIAEEGHAVGNHTQTHPKLMICSTARIQRELEVCQQMIFDATGVTPTLFRPPFGARRPAVLRIAKAMGLTTVLWNVTAKDWLPIGAEGILANIDRAMERNHRAGVGSNILLHDASHLDGVTAAASRSATIQATAALLKRPGLHFATL